MAKVYKARETREPFLLQSAAVQKWDMPDPQVYRSQAELFRILPPLATAVEMIMNVGSFADIEVKQVNKNEEDKEIPSHPLELLLKNPNPLQSNVEFMKDTLGYRLIPGNCYWWLNKASKDAPPDEIWIIPADKIIPVPDERLYLRGYEYDAGWGQKMYLETWEIVHFKRYNPFNQFVGLSVIEALAVSARAYIDGQRWNARLFGENNALLPGIVGFADVVNDVDWERLKKEFKDAASKREQIMLRGVGKGGVEWMQAAATHREMEFLEGLELTKREIWNAIAPGLSSMLDPSATEASSKTGENVFRNYAVYPIMKEIESKINMKNGVASTYGDNIKVEFEDIRITDRMMELKEEESYAKTHTIDEIRAEKYGDAPIGDERGKLLVAEIKTASPFGQEPKPQEPKPNENQDMTPTKADYMGELLKWKDKAVKRGPGKPVDFESDIIPQEVHDAIYKALPACKSKNDIRILFGKHIKTEKNDDRLVMLLENALGQI